MLRYRGKSHILESTPQTCNDNKMSGAKDKLDTPVSAPAAVETTAAFETTRSSGPVSTYLPEGPDSRARWDPEPGLAYSRTMTPLIPRTRS